jgi:hypothetical protein
MAVGDVTEETVDLVTNRPAEATTFEHRRILSHREGAARTHEPVGDAPSREEPDATGPARLES